MRNALLSIGGIFACLLFIGAGCGDTTTPTATNTESDTSVTVEEPTAPTADDTATPEAAVNEDAQGSAENVVKAFYSALQSDNKDAALAYLAPETKEYKKFDELWSEVKSWKFINVKVLDSKTEDGETYVDVVLAVEVDEVVDTDTDQVKVVEKDGKWWVLEFPA